MTLSRQTMSDKGSEKDTPSKFLFYSRNRESFVQLKQKLTHHKIILLMLLMLVLLTVFSCRTVLKNKSSIKKPKTSPIFVVTAKAHSSSVPIYLKGLGTVIPDETVTVKTQVNGQLLRVLFEEGQDVKQGELLAEIDPRPFAALVTQFEGQLARDEALLANARIDLQRYTDLWQQDSISKQTLDTQISLVKQLEGTVKFDKGSLENAKVNLTYCKIHSPIKGRVGLTLIDPGNFVQTSDPNGLFIINTLSPISVIFTLPEDDIPQVLKKIQSSKKLEVQAFDRTQNNLLAKGALLTIDNQIDPTTGTVKLKAEFLNKDYSLFPNQFVNVKLKVDTLQQATLIPTSAILHGVNGDFVYRVNEETNTVKMTPVKSTVHHGDESVITTNLQVGDRVVIQGTDKLSDGASISYTESASSPTSPSLKKSGQHKK